MTETTNNALLDISTITEPFDLATALVYMKENGEFTSFSFCGKDSSSKFQISSFLKRVILERLENATCRATAPTKKETAYKTGCAGREIL